MSHGQRWRSQRLRAESAAATARARELGQDTLFETPGAPADPTASIVGKHHAAAGDTELSAALWGARRAGRQRARLLWLLLEHDGLTDREAADLLDLERSSVNARRNELVDMGLVCDSGLRRVSPSTGLRNRVWAATPAGRAAVDNLPRRVLAGGGR